jgi:lysophospholipase L1-like esterase
MKRNLWKEALMGLATLAVTIVILYGVAEVAVRLLVDNGMNFNIEMWKYARDVKQRSADALIGHEHRADAHAFLMGVDVATNAEGHRDREIPLARQPGVGRIVMLGDSFIEGWGVPFEATISKRLEKLFDQAGEKVEVMNTGVGNYNTVMEVEAFLTRDAKFKPDMVVLNYTFNDAEPVPDYGSTNFLARNSEAAVFLVGGMDSIFRLFGERRTWDTYYLGLYDTPGWEAAKAAIHRLSDYCRANKVKLMIVSWPELHDVNNYRLQKITDLLHGVADAEKVPFVDLLNAVKGQDSSKLWVTPPDPHPNAYTNGLYAAYLFPYLKEEMAKPAS